MPRRRSRSKRPPRCSTSRRRQHFRAMILSALLTSVGINLGLCFLFFTLYSILRKQPGNVTVYGPRLIQAGKSQQTNAFNLERLLPTAGWVKRALEPTNEEILSNLGLDALVFTRVFVFSIRVFSFASVVGIFILLPVNYMGTEFEEFFDLPNKSLDSFSISNVNDGSNKLWIHFCAIYIFSAVVCYLLYCEHKYISSKRIAHFYSSKPQPQEFTVLVSGVPLVSGNSISETVESFFREYHSSTYLSHVVVHRTDKLKVLMNDAEKLYKKLTRVKSGTISRQKSKRDGFLGMFGKRVDVVDHYEKKLVKLEDDMRLKQSLLAGEEIPAAFVSFRTRHGAAIASNIQQGMDPTQWLTETAPEPQDVHWPFFTASFVRRWISNVVVFVAFVALIILYVIPVVLVQGLANLHQLETWFPFLKSILNMKIVSQVITGYLPSLIFQAFLMIVPPVMLLLSSMQGFISHSQIEKSACIKLLVFTVWNSFFANVLSGSALYRVNVFLEPKNIPRVLAAAVPAQASFFISYVVTTGWTGLSSEIFRLVPLLWSFMNKLFYKEDDKEFEVPPTPFCQEIPRILFFGLLGTTYFFLSPLILPFLLVYFCLGYVIYRNQLLNVYEAKYETGGKFWPIVHSSTIFSLVLMHIIAIGLFGLKKLPLASSLTIPLPVLTLLFSIYCQRRFLPNFKSYPTECLVNKDKADEREENMSEFYSKLVVAYRDPALSASQYSRDMSPEDPPLLRSYQS
uniref:CSC1-like protein HYP1 n=1 Tax=Brassica campestris TaxID=3711 RepID=M4FDH4_BRACM